jgi:hypothetical protein
MKKIILIACFALFGSTILAQSPLPYLNTVWKVDKLDSLKSAIGVLIGDAYKVEPEPFTADHEAVTVAFNGVVNKDRHIILTFRKGISGGDADMGIKPMPIVRQVLLEGLFVDLFAVYQKLFNPNESMEQVKQKGYINFNIKQDGKTYIVSFVREADHWQMNIRTY